MREDWRGVARNAYLQERTNRAAGFGYAVFIEPGPPLDLGRAAVPEALGHDGHSRYCLGGNGGYANLGQQVISHLLPVSPVKLELLVLAKLFPVLHKGVFGLLVDILAGRVEQRVGHPLASVRQPGHFEIIVEPSGLDHGRYRRLFHHVFIKFSGVRSFGGQDVEDVAVLFQSSLLHKIN